MSVISVKEIWRGRTGTSEIMNDVNTGVLGFGAGLLDQTKVSAVRIFRVRTDDAKDDVTLILQQAAGPNHQLPAIGDTYVTPTNQQVTGLKCVRIKPEHDQDDPYTWIVAVEYDSAIGVHPVQRVSIVEYSFRRYPWALTYAETSLGIKVPIVNSAGDPFDPPPEIDEVRPYLKITRNENDFNRQRALDYIDSVNADAFFNGDPGKWRCMNIQGVFMVDALPAYYQVIYEFEYRRLGWNLILVDAGYHVITFGTRTLAIDQSGAPYSSPVLLDGNGNQLNVGAVPVYRSYQIYPTKNFATLGLP